MKIWVNITTEDGELLSSFAVTRGNIALGGKVNQEPLQVANQIRETIERHFNTHTGERS